MVRTPRFGNPTRHLLRRTARAAAHRYNATAPAGFTARVSKCRRGPFRYRVVVRAD